MLRELRAPARRRSPVLATPGIASRLNAYASSLTATVHCGLSELDAEPVADRGETATAPACISLYRRHVSRNRDQPVGSVGHSPGPLVGGLLGGLAGGLAAASSVCPSLELPCGYD